MLFDLPADWVLKDIVPNAPVLLAITQAITDSGPSLELARAMIGLSLPHLAQLEELATTIRTLPDVPPCVTTLEEWNRYAAIVR